MSRLPFLTEVTETTMQTIVVQKGSFGDGCKWLIYVQKSRDELDQEPYGRAKTKREALEGVHECRFVMGLQDAPVAFC